MEEVKKVWRKKIAESKTRIYYATTNGNFYYIDKRTNEKVYIKPRMSQGNLHISLGGGHHGIARNIMAKAWIKEFESHDVVEHINGNIYDFRVENLRITKKNRKER